MKTIIIIIAAIVTMSCHAQTLEQSKSFDSLRNEMKNLNMNFESLKMNLNLCHEEFSTGTEMIILGIIGTAAGTALYGHTDTNIIPYLLMGCGGVLGLTGTIFHIDSHKYIGRAE